MTALSDPGATPSGPVTAADHRSNNFDALRLIGALVVIIGHGYALLARPLETVSYTHLTLPTTPYV